MQELPTSDGQPGHNGLEVPYCVWEIPPANMVFRLSLEVVESLSRDVMEGFQTVPRRGLEVGGVLLGRSEAKEASAAVSVDAAAPLECEHDVQTLGALRAAHPPDPQSGLRIVGFYRSQTRRDLLEPDAEDLAIMARSFRGTPEVFLLVRPAAGGGGTAALFLWDGEQFQSPQPCLEFPFQSGRLRSGEFRVEYAAAIGWAARQVRTHPLIEAVEAPHKEPEMSPRRRRVIPFPIDAARCGAVAAAWLRHWSAQLGHGHLPPAWKKAAAVSVAGVVVLVAAATWGVHRYRQPAQPLAASVALTVDRDAGALRVRWDRGSEAVRRARGATLWIDDGPRQSRLNLDVPQLRQGSVAYWPANDDVNFRLDVFDPRHTVTESVRVVGLVPPPAPVIPEPAPPVETASAPKPRVKPSPFSDHRQPAIENDSAGMHPTTQVAAQPPPAAVQPLAPATPAAAAPAAQVTPPQEASRAVPPEAATQVSMSYDTVTDSRVGRVVGKIPLIGRLHRKRQEDLTPPQPVEIFKPAVPAELRRGFTGEVPIDVKVHVGESGKVEGAELLSDVSGGPAARLAGLALHAARRSKFTPARMGDRTVPADVVLHYRVSGTAAQIAAQPGTAE